MPFDGTEFVQSYTLNKLDQVIGLLAAEDQWCKGIEKTPDGRHCIIGALRAVNAQLVLEPVILQAIKTVTGRRCGRIERFNDAAATDHTLVMRVLERARYSVIAGDLQTSLATEGTGRLRRVITGLWDKLRP
jgi:hypothetical protein